MKFETSEVKYLLLPWINTVFLITSSWYNVFVKKKYIHWKIQKKMINNGQVHLNEIVHNSTHCLNYCYTWKSKKILNEMIFYIKYTFIGMLIYKLKSI